MKCELSPQAETDLLEIGDTIARDNPQRAASFVRELLSHSRKIAQLPETRPARDNLAEGLRSCLHQPHVVYFTVSTEAVRIERILHGSRDITPDNFLLDELDPLD